MACYNFAGIDLADICRDRHSWAQLLGSSTHAHAHTHTHTNAHARAHTCAHTHTRECVNERQR